MSKSLNNFCEDLVNGSNPRYTYSQPSITQQVAWQVQKEEASKQAQWDAVTKAHQARNDAMLYTPHSSLSTSSSSFSSPSFTMPSLPSGPSLSSFSTPSFSSASTSYSPSYSSYL